MLSRPLRRSIFPLLLLSLYAQSDPESQYPPTHALQIPRRKVSLLSPHRFSRSVFFPLHFYQNTSPPKADPTPLPLSLRTAGVLLSNIPPARLLPPDSTLRISAFPEM